MALVKLFLVSRLMFLAFAWFGTLFVPLTTGYLGNQVVQSSPYLVWIWTNMDGRHLIEIATKGYENFNFAYFPLYSVLVSAIGYIVKIPHVYLGILISLISLLGAMSYLYKIVRLDFDEKVARTALLLLAIFPLSSFFQAAYTDALFLFLSTASFYYARKNNWVLVGVFGFLTTLTRMSGVALVIGLFIEWLLQNKGSFEAWKRKPYLALQTGFVGIIFASLGFFFYLAYLQIFHGDFLLFQKSFSAWQQSSLTFPPQVFYRYLKIFFTVDKMQYVYWVAALEFLCTILYLALSWYVAQKVRLSYGIFMFFLLLLPMFSGTFAGMPRYILHLFPAFIGLALLTSTNKNLHYVLCTVFLILGFIFTTLFTRGYFLT